MNKAETMLTDTPDEPEETATEVWVGGAAATEDTEPEPPLVLVLFEPELELDEDWPGARF